jgi:hypothetical protein
MPAAMVVWGLLLLPKAAFACPVCFGENDSPLASGINYGILAMLVVVAGLWVAFASFFIYLRRRAKLVEAAASELSAKARSAATSVTQGGTI